MVRMRTGMPWRPAAILAYMLPVPMSGHVARHGGGGGGAGRGLGGAGARGRGRARSGCRSRAREGRKPHPAGVRGRAAACAAGGRGCARRASALCWTPWGGARVGAGRARARKQRRGGRTRLGQSWVHSEPCAAAILRPRGRGVAQSGGWRQTRHSAHRRQGRAADGEGTLACCLDAVAVNWAEAALIRARAAEHPCDGQGGQCMWPGRVPLTRHERVQLWGAWRVRRLRLRARRGALVAAKTAPCRACRIFHVPASGGHLCVVRL